MWGQYTIMDCHGVTNTGILWVLNFQPHRFQGVLLGFSHSNYRAMWNWWNNWWWRRDRKSIFKVIFACGRSWYHSFRVQLVSYLLRTNTKLSLNVYISCSILSSKISMGGTGWYIKPMRLIFLFSATCYSLSNMCTFNCNPFMVVKLSNVMDYYTIIVTPPFIYLVWWYIDTFKMVENEYLPIDFVGKD